MLQASRILLKIQEVISLKGTSKMSVYLDFEIQWIYKVTSSLSTEANPEHLL